MILMDNQMVYTAREIEHPDQQSRQVDRNLICSAEYQSIQIGGLDSQTDILHAHTDDLNGQFDNLGSLTEYWEIETDGPDEETNGLHNERNKTSRLTIQLDI